MHVLERGSGSPLVLFHGFGVDHRLLIPLDPVIDAAGSWRRLYFDFPGHGESPVGDVSSAEALVAAVETELRARIGTEPFAIIGNSFGGMIARRVAHDFRGQVMGLAVIAPVMVASHEQRLVPEHVVLPPILLLWKNSAVPVPTMRKWPSCSHARTPRRS